MTEEPKKAPPFLHKSDSTFQSGDIRKEALSAYGKNQAIWGRNNAGANNVLQFVEPEQVEPYMLDFALRKLWALQRDGNETTQCYLSPENATTLRQLVLHLVKENIEKLTSEHSFEIPDPEIVAQRAEEKKQRGLEEAKAREARKADIEREKKEREQKMVAEQKLQEEAEKARIEEEAAVTEEEKKAKKKKKKKKDKEAAGGEKVKKKKSKEKEGEGEGEEKPKKRRKTTKESEIGTDEEKTKKKRSKKKNKEGEDDTQRKPRKRRIKSEVISKGAIKKMQEGSAVEEKPVNSARNRRRTLEPTKGRLRMPPKLVRSNVPEDDPVPTITIKKTLVSLDTLHKIIGDKVNEKFASEAAQTGIPADRFLDFYHLSVQGPRPANEDEYVVIEPVNEWLGLSEDIVDRYSYFAVYDGHSGKYTSLFTRSQLHHYLFNHPDFPGEKSFHDSFNEVDKYVNEVQQRHTFSCGTTALNVVIKNNEDLLVGNVGDCRGFLCRGGNAFEIATAHNLDREDEKERIQSLGGAVVWFGTWRVNGILAVSRSIGDYNLCSLVTANPDVTQFKIQKDDEFLVVASDGLWDGISGEEMIKIVKDTVQEKGREFVCQTLCEVGVAKKTNDNVTCVVVFFNH